MSVNVPSGYKQTKVGVIPEAWNVVKLREVVKVSQGLQIPISHRFNEPSENRVFYITIPHTEGKKVEYIEDAKKSVLCNKDDLLVVRTGSGVGKIIKGVEGAFHNNFFKIKFLNELDTDFMYAFLTSSRTQFLMNTYAGSSAIPDLNHGDFYSLDFLLPPLKEQQKIAQILTTWDDAISKQETLIKAQEELKKGLMQNLLSGEVRFDGFDGEWEEVRLGDIGKTYGGLTGKTAEDFGRGDSKYITYKNIFNNSKINPFIFESVKVNVTEKQNKVIYGDILFTTSSETPEEVGMSSVLLTEIDDVYLNSFCFGYRAKDLNALDPKFSRFYFRSYYMRDKISRLAQGSTRFNLSKLQVMKIKIKLPLQAEQQKIAQVLTLADKNIDLLKNELEALKEQKRGLMQRLLSGEARVLV